MRDLQIYYVAERLHFAAAGAGATSNGVVGHRWASAPRGSRFCTEVVTTADRASPVRVGDDTPGGVASRVKSGYMGYEYSDLLVPRDGYWIGSTRAFAQDGEAH